MNDPQTPEAIRRALREAANAEVVDPQRLMELSSALARADEDRVWFSVDAGLIQRLGAELVAKQETAVAELIKNAYDADATSVNVVFANCSAPGGTLTIEDTGGGMTREQLVDGFMRISTSNKAHSPVSPVFRRQRAGRKGIGRFAAQRLGTRLVVTTQTDGDEAALQVEIDWTRFSPDQDLSSVASSIRRVAGRGVGTGTTLEIFGLREAWSDAQINRVYRHVLTLLRPGWIDASAGAHDTAADIFDVRFLWEDNEGAVAIADEENMFLNHALARVDASVGDDGRVRCMIRSERLGLNEALQLPDELGPVHPGLRRARVVALYFIHDPELLPHLLRTRIVELLGDVGGIRVFRNGFRVAPYGGAGNDWLELDALSRRRSVLPPVANTNWYGFVEVDDAAGEWFNETSSREGLVENEAFASLRKVANACLVQAALRIATARGKKTHAGGGGRKPAEQLRALAQQLDDGSGTGGVSVGGGGVTPSSGSGPVPLPALPDPAQIARELKAIAEEQEARDRESLQEMDALRVLASLGLLIGQFTHEIRHVLVALGTDMANLRDVTASLGNPLLSRVAARLVKNIDGLGHTATYLDRALADSASRQTRSLDMREVLSDFRDVVRPRADQQGINVEIAVAGAGLVTRRVHAAEWASVLFNLYTNSEKAIRREEVRGKILIECRRSEGTIEVRFSDNGCGIPEADRERVFDAFFTTSSPDAALDGSIVQGTGLGLKIVRDILASQGGRIEVATTVPGYATTFLIVVPCAGGT